MTQAYPKIRIRAVGGALLVCEGLSFTFYMRHPHEVVAPGIERSLDAYLRAAGPKALGWYADDQGEYRKLDEAGWKKIRSDLHAPDWALIRLYDEELSELGHQFEYSGRPLIDLFGRSDPNETSMVRFWLPSEYLEEHGPARVRELALELAAPLPFCSGYAGLAFNSEFDFIGVTEQIAKHCFRYPGMDVSCLQWGLGTRIWGVQWLTFLGQPVLGELGGAAGLRARLHEPGTTVQELEGDRAVITLGSQPEAGDTERGQLLPAYRELARILEPWLYEGMRVFEPSNSPEENRRWVRRFLD